MLSQAQWKVAVAGWGSLLLTGFHFLGKLLVLF